MLDREAEVAEDRRVRFRIGINLGDIIVDGDDIFGDGVNVAARLEALAEPGGICISRTVRNQVRDKLAYDFVDMGEQNVKNIARPVRVDAMTAAAAAATPLVLVNPSHPVSRGRLGSRSALLLAGLVATIAIGLGTWWTWLQAPVRWQASQVAAKTEVKAAPLLSAVVLPLTNLSDDREQDYFVDAITDDLTADLSRIAGSLVIARTTAFTYKGKAVDVKQIGRDLGVRYVLEGDRKSVV